MDGVLPYFKNLRLQMNLDKFFLASTNVVKSISRAKHSKNILNNYISLTNKDKDFIFFILIFLQIYRN